MKAFCSIVCKFPMIVCCGIPADDECYPLEAKGKGPNLATAIERAIADIDEFYRTADWETRESVLGYDPTCLRVKATACNAFGLCDVEADAGYQVRLGYSASTCLRRELVAKRCKNLLDFANNAISGFLSAYEKWLMGKRRESKKGGNGE